MHQALYRKWRPRNFDEVCGQEQVTSILKYECQTGHFSHAYLFCGSRGTGKTSCAKILAKAVNCEHPTAAGPCGECAACRSIDSGAATDVLEMDAASNNGVDDIRDIRDEVIYTPSELKYRVYIIDEVHMLSVSAFNALLKTLEEPPEHVIFILATTELQKLPATIVSRCQRFDFRRIATADLSAHLAKIAEKEGFTLEPEAARLIARQAQGGMRDAISLLELCAGARRPITPELVTETVGTTGREGVGRVVASLVRRDYDRLFAAVDDMVRSSRDLAVFWQELISYYRDMLVVRTVPESDAVRYLDLTDSETAALRSLAAQFTKETLLWHISLLEDALFAMQRAFAVRRTVAEVTLVRLCDPALDTATEAILSRLSRVEEQLAGGVIPVAAPVAAPVSAPVSAPVAAPDTPPLSDQAAPTAPKAPPTVSPAPPTPAQTSPTRQPESTAPTAGQRILRPLRNFREVADRVSESDPIIGSFLRLCRAFRTDDGKIILRFEQPFQCSMALPDKKPPEALRRTLSVCLGHAVAPEDIIGEIEGQADPASSLDVIIEALEDDAASGETPPRESE